MQPNTSACHTNTPIYPHTQTLTHAFPRVASDATRTTPSQHISHSTIQHPHTTSSQHTLHMLPNSHKRRQRSRYPPPSPTLAAHSGNKSRVIRGVNSDTSKPSQLRFSVVTRHTAPRLPARSSGIVHRSIIRTQAVAVVWGNLCMPHIRRRCVNGFLRPVTGGVVRERLTPVRVRPMQKYACVYDHTAVALQRPLAATSSLTTSAV